MANEIRLIDANAFRDWLSKQKRIGKNLVIMMLDETPTVDAKPVVHGRWKVANDGTHFCSLCGCDAPYTWDDIDRRFVNSADDVPNRPSNFCPNFGAQMDGGNEDG